ncbi:MAG: hypothetical protein WCR67_07235 [Bacilli bacterium]
MSRTKRKLGVGLVALTMISLASCTTTYIRYPDDYTETLYEEVNSFAADKAVEIVENNREQYYKDVLSAQGVYAEAVNQLLLAIASKAHNYSASTDTGVNVSQIVSDYNTDYSVYDSISGGTTVEKPVANFTNLQERSKTSLVSTSKNGTYAKDNLFYEDKYLTSLKQAFTLGAANANVELTNQNGVLVTPYMDYDDIFTGDNVYNNNTDRYSYYFKNSNYESTQIDYLTSEYIYNKTYSAIGNTNARNVQVISLSDLTDDKSVGSAKKLLEAYVKDYIKGDGTAASLKGTDPDFSILTRLWKGITKDVVDNIDPSTDTDDSLLEARYGADTDHSVVLSDSEEQWLKNNNLISDNYQVNNYTLAGEVTADQKTVLEGLDDLNKADSGLESTYTGSYTYDVATGVRKAIDSVATKNFVTKGIYLKSEGLSSLPTSLTDRIFSLDLTSNKEDVAYMKENPGKSKDALSIYGADGNRYITTTGNIANSGSDNIIHYDSSSKTYYLCRILDVVSSSSMNKTNTSSMYHTEDGKALEKLARQVAYKMSSTGSYKTDSSIYWLRRTKITYSDEDFLEYMKSNYKDLFKTESSIDDEEKISISNITNFGNWF